MQVEHVATNLADNGAFPDKGVATSVSTGRGGVPPLVDIVEGVVWPAEAVPQEMTGITDIIEASKKQKLAVAAWRGYLRTGGGNIFRRLQMRGFRDLHGG
jgi:hypothetical protein